MATKMIKVESLKDARTKLAAAATLGLSARVVLHGTWECSDGNLLFAGGNATVIERVARNGYVFKSEGSLATATAPMESGTAFVSVEIA